MKLLRNSEVRKTLLVYSVVSISVTGIAWIWDSRFGLLMLGVCLIFLLLYQFVTYRRYRRISELALEIDKILHGEGRLLMEGYAEGELAILQSEIYKMTVRLREQQQLLKKDKLYLADSLADISHQIRTPLTSINLLVSFLSEPDLSDERRKKYACELYELLARIDWLITALLKISRLDAGTVRMKTETISLDKLLQTAIAPLLVPMDLRNQTLEVSATGEFTGDVAWTCEAVANIVKNCMEHTPDGGRIKLYASDNPLYTEIVIADNGSGIAKEDLPHIFERFYKGKDSDEKSFGIGLALARMIISTQNGTIKAENESPVGAKFTLRFYKGIV